MGVTYEDNRPLFCCKKQNKYPSTRKAPGTFSRVPVTGELVHYTIAEGGPADVIPVPAIERSSEPVDVPEGSPVPELVLLTSAPRSRTASPSRMVALSRPVSPPSHPLLFSASGGTDQIEDPQRFLLYQQTHQNSPRQLPSRCSDDSSQVLGGKRQSPSAVAVANLPAFSRGDTTTWLKDFSPQNVTSMALEGPHSPKGRAPNLSGRKMPTLDVVDAAPVSDELDCTEGARTSPDHANLRVQTGLALPSQFKTRTLKGQHMHANDLPEPCFSAPICGHLMAAAAEHPEELSPQSAMEKKTPSGLNCRCRTEGDGSSSVNDPCTQLHTGCEPLPHPAEPPIQSTHDEVTKQSDLRFLECRQLQRDVQEQEFSDPQHTANEKCLADEVVQPMDGAPERIRSILSQEELLEGAEKNLDVASNPKAEHDTSAHDMETKKDDGQSTISTTISQGRILRSKTVIGPTVCSSPVPQDTAVRRETALVQWNHHKNASPSVDSTRGRQKTYTPAGSQSVRRTQSDVRGLSFGDVNVERASGEVVEMLTQGLDSSRGLQRRGTSVFRRSPERHREYLITRSTPENHFQCNPTSPFCSCSQEGMIRISADAENIRREPGQEKQGVSNTGPECEATITTGNATQRVRDKSETTSNIVFSMGYPSTFQGQVCLIGSSAIKGQDRSGKHGITTTSKAGGRVRATPFARLPSSAHQKRKTALQTYKVRHSKILLLSHQLQKRLWSRSIRRQMKGTCGGQGLVMRGGERKPSHHYDEAVTVQQVTGDGGGEETSCDTSSLSESNTTKDKVIGEHLTTRMRLLEKFPPAFSPPKSSLSGCIARESIVEGTLRKHHAVSNGCDACNLDAAAQSVTAIKSHRMEANARLCSSCTLKRRAASCIESKSHVITQQQFKSGPLLGCRQRAAKSLWCSAGSPEAAQQALVLIKQPKVAYVTAHVQATCSPIADTPSTGDAFSKEPMDSGPRRSSTVPPGRSEADHVFGSVLAPEEEGTVACSDCAIGEAHPTPLLVGAEMPYQEPRTPQVFPGEVWSEVDSKTDRDLIFTTSSRIACSQLRQCHATNMPSKLLRKSAILGDVSTAAQLLHEPGTESSARPHELPLRLSVTVAGGVDQLSTDDGGTNASDRVRALPHFLGPHLLRGPQAMLFTSGREPVPHTTDDHASEKPIISPAGIANSSFPVACGSVVLPHTKGWDGITEGQVTTGSGCELAQSRILPGEGFQFNENTLQTQCCVRDAETSLNLKSSSGGTGKCAAGSSLGHCPTDLQEEAPGLPPRVQPCTVLSTAMHCQGSGQEHTQTYNYCPITVNTSLHGLSCGGRPHSQGAARLRGRPVARVSGALRRATVHCLHCSPGAHRISGAGFCCSEAWHDNTYCHVPLLCSHHMRERILPVHHHGTLLRRCYSPRKLYMKEEALKWRIHSRRKHVQLLNKQLTVQQQQLEQSLQLQQIQLQQSMKRANHLVNRLQNDSTLKKQRFRRSQRQPRLRRRRTTAFCAQEGPSAFLDAAAAAALAILGACGQRAHKPLVGSEALAFPLSGPTQRLAGTSKTEDIGGAAAGPSPELQQEPLTPKVREEALQENRRTSLGPSMDEECAPKSQGEVLCQTLGSVRGVVRQFQRYPAPIKESDESLTNPQQNVAYYKRNTLQIQLGPPNISHLDPSEMLEKGSADSAGPVLPQATTQLPCPKLAIGLELSFPSPGGAIQYEGSYSRMDGTLAPGQPGIRSFPIQNLQPKRSVSRNWDVTYGCRKTEPPDSLPGVRAYRKCNSLSRMSSLSETRRSLSTCSRASYLDSQSNKAAIRNRSSGQRRHSHADAATNKAGVIRVVEDLYGTPAKYRCNAVPVAYHRDPRISIFSQLFEDSFRREKNLLLLRMQKHVGSTSIIRPQRNREGITVQRRAMLAAKALTRHNVTSRSAETAKIVNSKQAVSPALGRITGFSEAVKDRKRLTEISPKPTDGNTDNSGTSEKLLLMEDAIERELCYRPESACPTSAQAKTHPQTIKCMNATPSTEMLVPSPHRKQESGAFLPAIEAESIDKL